MRVEQVVELDRRAKTVLRMRQRTTYQCRDPLPYVRGREYQTDSCDIVLAGAGNYICQGDLSVAGLKLVSCLDTTYEVLGLSSKSMGNEVEND